MEKQSTSADNPTITEVTPPADLPSDPNASLKPAGSHDAFRKIALSHLSEISVCVEVGTQETQDSIDQPTEECHSRAPEEGFAFVLGRLIGEGGMGEVREAKQTSLGRTVAVKRPKLRAPASAKGTSDIELFAREAAVTARLEHPHIIPVHDLGLGPDGLPLLAMKLVRGTPWSDLLKHDKDLSPRDRLARHLATLIDVAQAVAFAHERGIIHRDLKPSQVMVGRHGEVYLMDWGIAASFGERKHASATDFPAASLAAMDCMTAPNPAGTSAYMAPEQTERNGARLGPWTDVWLLGAILYEILTRRPPYPYPRSADSFVAAARGIVESPEERIRKRPIPESCDVPPKVSALCMDCLQPGIGDRVPSASVFIERLKDYQTGATRREESRTLTGQALELLSQIEQELEKDNYNDLEECDRTLSRAVGLDPENAEAVAAKQKVLAMLADEAIEGGDLHRARVQAGRLLDDQKRDQSLKRIKAAEHRAHRARVQRLAALAMCGILVIVVTSIALISRTRIAFALRKAEAAEQQLGAANDQAVYDLYVSNIRLAQREIDQEHFRQAQEALLATPPRYREWEWGYLIAAAHPEAMSFSGHTGPVQSVAFSPDGQMLASASRDGTARIWEVKTGRETRRLDNSQSAIRRLTWSPDGKKIAAACADKTANLFDADTGKPLLTLGQHSTAVVDVHFAGPSEIATLTSAAHLRFFDAQSAKLLRDFDLKSDRAFAFDISPDGKLAAAGVGPSGALLLATDTGTSIVALAPDAAECSAVRFSPDGTKVAVAITGARSYICAVPSGAILANFTDSDFVIAENQRAYGWAADIRWADDGNAVIAGMRARPGSRAYRWSSIDSTTAKFQSMQPASFPTGNDVCSIDVTRNGKFVAVGDEAGAICLYDQAADAGTTRPLFDTEGGMHGLRWSPDGRALVASSFSQHAYKLDALQESIEWDLPLPDRSHCAAIDPEQRMCAFSARHFGFVVKSARNGEELFRIPLKPGSDDASWIAFSPDAKSIATVCSSYPQPHAPAVELWSANDGHHLAQLSTPNDLPNTAAFSPTGKVLVMAGADGFLDLVALNSGAKLWHAQALDGRINAVSFSNDGHLIAIAGAGGGAAIVEVANGGVVKRLAEHGSEITDIAFSPNGKRIATAAHDAALGIWDPATGRLLCSLKRHSGRLWQAQWSPDGTKIATASSGVPGVHIWEPMPMDGGSEYAYSSAGVNWAERLRAWQASRLRAKVAEPSTAAAGLH